MFDFITNMFDYLINIFDINQPRFGINQLMFDYKIHNGPFQPKIVQFKQKFEWLSFLLKQAVKIAFFPFLLYLCKFWFWVCAVAFC